jgi:hypothetical protein
MKDAGGILFSETQRCTSWRVWALLVIIDGIWLVSCVAWNGFGVAIGNVPANVYFWVVSFIFVFGITAFFASLSLRVTIIGDDLHLSMMPFPMNMMVPDKISLRDIKSADIRSYDSLKEYGGWGIRFGDERGDAITLNGTSGLQLEYQSGRKLLIGTRKPEELKQALCGIGCICE